MPEAVLSKFLYNGSFYNVSEFDSIYVEKGPSVYEVIRIMDRVPLFLEEHFERLINSAKLLNYSLDITLEDMKKSISEMLNKNNIDNYNIKIVINGLDSSENNTYYYFNSGTYPTNEMYNAGVDTFLYSATRENPNAKVIRKNMRDEINRLIDIKNCYEAILVNESNEVTEGSRSNLFFIKNNEVYTAPAEDVLLGITRQRIISLCRRNNFPLIETKIEIEDLNSFNACFISGTSPKILPIRSIDELHFDPNDNLLMNLMGIYDKEIDTYILKYK